MTGARFSVAILTGSAGFDSLLNASRGARASSCDMPQVLNPNQRLVVDWFSRMLLSSKLSFLWPTSRSSKEICATGEVIGYPQLN
jgi:hypothetical protein